MYKFPSEMKSDISKMYGKKIERITNVTSSGTDRIRKATSEHERKEAFSLFAWQYYLSIGDFGTLAFRSVHSGDRSVIIKYFSDFPSIEEITRDLHSQSEPLLIEADDPVYSDGHFAQFIGTSIEKIETIQAHEKRQAGMRRNERGLRITNDEGKQFIIGWELLDDGFPHGLVIISPYQINKEPGLFTFTEA